MLTSYGIVGPAQFLDSLIHNALMPPIPIIGVKVTYSTTSFALLFITVLGKVSPPYPIWSNKNGLGYPVILNIVLGNAPKDNRRSVSQTTPAAAVNP
jgi:hypothetical protein